MRVLGSGLGSFAFGLGLFWFGLGWPWSGWGLLWVGSVVSRVGAECFCCRFPLHIKKEVLAERCDNMHVVLCLVAHRCKI